MWLIVGLGNPGTDYLHTRHNTGWQALDLVAKNFTATSWQKQKKIKSEIAEIKIGRARALLLKPQTFMNESGSAVNAAVAFYKIKQQNIIVCHDDLDFPIGTVKTQFNRSSAGHNGVQDIIEKLHSQKFHRVRIGIGRDNPSNQKNKQKKVSGRDYVLTTFTPTDTVTLKNALDKIPELLKNIITNRH